MNEIKISELKTDETISNLIPEMTEEEYLSLKTNIEENDLRHEIDINHDNTILDGRHRVRVFESMGRETIPFKRHNLNKSEAIEFVRDTAVERRNLSDAQRRAVVFNSDELVSEIRERARENKQNAMKVARESNPNNQSNDSLGSIDPQQLKPKTNTAKELAKLSKSSEAQVRRHAKLRRENPEGAARHERGESTLWKEYSALPSVKENTEKKQKKEAVDDVPIKVPSKPKRDIREEMIEREASLSEEDRKKAHEGMTTENFKSYLENIRYTLQQMKDLGMNEEIKNSKEKLTKLMGEF